MNAALGLGAALAPLLFVGMLYRDRLSPWALAGWRGFEIGAAAVEAKRCLDIAERKVAQPRRWGLLVAWLDARAAPMPPSARA